MIGTALDHLVVTSATLANGVELVERTMGLPMDGGGDHVAMGTHNRLQSLGPDDYLEVIAANPAATPPGRARFYDLDNRTDPARLTNWVLRVDDLSEALAEAPEGIGEGLALARGPFSWCMAVPADGKLPFDGMFPSFIQWSTPHPAPSIPDVGARLDRLTLSHPDAVGLSTALAPFLSDDRIEVVEGAVGMTAILRTGHGTVTLA